jgi:hypothetical protein
VPFIDPAVAGLERTMIARAFLSLPKRWQAVLWHTEIEGAKPVEIAAMLGLTANGVAALAYRAREGLRQAYLQMHLSSVTRQECRPIAGKLGAYVRGGLAKRESAAVAAHLDGCADCQTVYAELADVNVALRGIAPIFLGPAAAAYLAAKGSVLAAAGGWISGHLAWLGQLPKQLWRAPKQQQAAVAGTAVVAAAGLVALFTLVGNTGHVPPHVPHPAAAPAPPAAASPPKASPPKAPPTKPAPPKAAAKPRRAPSAARPAPTPPPPVHLAKAPAPRRHHRPPPAPLPQLAALINPVGELLQGGTGIVGFTVTNAGKRVARNPTAAITLPPGVTYLGAGALGLDAMTAAAAPGGWTCRAVPAGAACTHGPLAAGASTTSYLEVAVAPDAPLAAPPSISVGDGGRRVTARAITGVTAAGLPARYAATGQYTVVTTGRALPKPPQCGPWRELHVRRPALRSSSASVVLPGQVAWAGLYWSWVGDQQNAGIELRGPGGAYQRVTGADTAPAPGGQLHQAFAAVTSQVRQYGAGQWEAAIPRLASGGVSSGDSDASCRDWDDAGGYRRSAHRETRYVGWTLVVVAADPAAPSGEVMVLDGSHAVNQADPRFAVPLDGLSSGGRRAGVQLVAWDNDDDGPDKTAFTEVLNARSAVTFGRAGGAPSKHSRAGGDPYLVGVIAVTDPVGTHFAATSSREFGEASEDLPLPRRVQTGSGQPRERRGQVTCPGRRLAEPAPGVPHGVGQRAVADAGLQRSLTGHLPDSGQLRRVWRPERKLGPRLDAGGQQFGVGCPGQLSRGALASTTAGPGARRVRAGTKKLPKRAMDRSRNVDHARDAPSRVVEHPGGQVADIRRPKRPSRIARGKHPAARRQPG